MAKLASEGKTATPVREATLALIASVPQKNWRGEVSRLFYFVRDKIRYTKDIRGIETVQTPVKTLEYRQGDCDDQVTLLASMLETIGHPARFVAIGFKPHHFAHVYLETQMPTGGWVALDPTEQKPLGWEPPNPVTRMVQAVF